MLLFNIKDNALDLYSFLVLAVNIYYDIALNIYPIIFSFVSHGFKERIVKYWLANFKVHVHPLLPPRTLEQVRKNRGKN